MKEKLQYVPYVAFTLTLLTSHVTKRQEANIFKHEEQFIEDWL